MASNELAGGCSSPHTLRYVLSICIVWLFYYIIFFLIKSTLVCEMYLGLLLKYFMVEMKKYMYTHTDTHIRSLQFNGNILKKNCKLREGCKMLRRSGKWRQNSSKNN